MKSLLILQCVIDTDTIFNPSTESSLIIHFRFVTLGTSFVSENVTNLFEIARFLNSHF